MQTPNQGLLREVVKVVEVVDVGDASCQLMVVMGERG
jgi:hypothetical protein